MSPEEKALRDAFLAEMWPTCREVSREDRAAEKAIRDAHPQPVDKPVRMRLRKAS